MTAACPILKTANIHVWQPVHGGEGYQRRLFRNALVVMATRHRDYAKQNLSSMVMDV